MVVWTVCHYITVMSIGMVLNRCYCNNSPSLGSYGSVPWSSWLNRQFDSPELAMAVAAEWDAQTSTKGLEPAVMPLMALASTAIDQVWSDIPLVDHNGILKYKNIYRSTPLL